MKTAKRYTYFVVVDGKIITTCNTIAVAQRAAADHADAKIVRMPRMTSRSGRLTVSRAEWHTVRKLAVIAANTNA
jgi:predicted NAD-dependent protein-ADP-ribosyltransferase YbiA (DUF1768 family)